MRRSSGVVRHSRLRRASALSIPAAFSFISPASIPLNKSCQRSPSAVTRIRYRVLRLCAHAPLAAVVRSAVLRKDRRVCGIFRIIARSRPPLVISDNRTCPYGGWRMQQHAYNRPMLVPNPKGGFSFLKGISPYSAGAVAQPGYEIEHVRLASAVPLQAGFAAVQARLKSLGRPVQALCGMELRSPKPFTFTGFNEFNGGYVAVLRSWGILLESGV